MTDGEIPPWRRRPPKRRAHKPPLSQDLIVATALTVLGQEGIDSVTMRRVAEALETGPASLYVHVANKEELHELMFDRVLGEVALPQPDPSQWRDQLKQLLRDQLQQLLAHQGIAKVAWTTMVPVGPNALRHSEAILALLHAGGYDERRAAFAFDALSLYTKAVAYEGSSWQAGDLDATEAARRGQQVQDYIASLPAESFRYLPAAGKYFNAETAQARFEFGLDMLLGRD